MPMPRVPSPALAAGILAPLVGCAVAEAGLFDKKNDAQEPVVVEVERIAPTLPQTTGVFGPILDGIHPGSVPAGLPSLSAQSCNACHYEAHDTWADSAHAGTGSDAWRAAAQATANPACFACHQPLTVQRDVAFDFDAGDVNAPVTTPNPTFDAGLHLEGVTCAACHVRDGAVLGSQPITEGPAAHPAMGWSEELTASEGCASCHQLTWPGADRPLYDTYGEWKRSGYADAGVTCASCHLGPGAGDGTVSHALVADLRRALTIGIEASLDAKRGDTPYTATVSLTNTGAGHAVPTGSPWRALQVELLLEGPPADGGAPLEVGRTEVVLGRTLAEAPPWNTTDDTRLQVAERRELAFSAPLLEEHPAGPWAFVVRVRERINGQPAGAATVVKRLPLRVD